MKSRFDLQEIACLRRLVDRHLTYILSIFISLIQIQKKRGTNMPTLSYQSHHSSLYNFYTKPHLNISIKHVKRCNKKWVTSLQYPPYSSQIRCATKLTPQQASTAKYHLQVAIFGCLGVTSHTDAFIKYSIKLITAMCARATP